MSIFGKILKKIPNPIKKVPKQIPKQFDKAKDQATDKIKEAAEAAVGEALTALRDITSPAVQEAFKFALKRLIKMSHLAPKSVSFEGQAIVGVGFDFDLQAALGKVRQWSEHPPKSSNDLKHFIIDLAPTHVKVFASAGFSLGIDLSVSGAMTWEKDYLIEHWGEIVG